MTTRPLYRELVCAISRTVKQDLPLVPLKLVVAHFEVAKRHKRFVSLRSQIVHLALGQS